MTRQTWSAIQPFELPESSSGGEALFGAVAGRVVGGVGVPAGPDDPQPGAGEDPDGVGVVLAAPAGIGIQLGAPSGTHVLVLPEALVTGAAPHSAMACSAVSTRSGMGPTSATI
jgi:hypothetical protein